ncbi:MAG: hypothetical protein J6C01_00690 [Lachnospiraceae bacterium]|nr:hypothetical protein [Lachnospiraceae bacterium]
MELQRPLGVEILPAVAFVYFCGTMRLAFSLACKGENAERIKSEARNMKISIFTCLQG